MSSKNVEIQLLEDYLDGAMKADDPKEAQRNLALYERQLAKCKAQNLDFNESWCDAMVFYLQANQKLRAEGFVERTMRDTARQSSGFDGIAPALLAREREASRAREAISLLDKAISVHPDDVDFWFMRASLHYALKNKKYAMNDADYILSNYNNNQEVYIAARKLKDEIETLKGDDCFIATAVYETSECIELTTLRSFRDDVLLNSVMGRALVSLYYQTSPHIARLLSRSRRARVSIRILLLDPIIVLLRKRASHG